MKFRGIVAGALALVLSATLAFGQAGPGTSPLSVVKGGTGAATAAGARTNLGVVIGTNVQAWDADLDCIAANSTAGLMAYTGAGTCSFRTLTAPAAGFTITNPAGTAGNPTFVLANDLAALEALASTGFAVRTTTDTWAQRALTAPAAGFTITNPAGVAGDPTFVLANDLAALEGLSGTGIARRTGTDAWSLGTVVSIAEGGTGQATAPLARASSGLNVDSFTGHGDSIYTILATDRTVGTNAAFTASRTWTLPAANTVNPGQEIIVADFQGTVTASNTLVISRAGSDTVNGGTAATITAANGAYLLKSDGTSKWTAQALGAAAAGGVSSVTCGTGLSGGAITTSGTCALASIAAGTVLGNKSTSSAVPTAQSVPVLLNTLTASASATLGDTTSFSSTYSAYDIVFTNLLPATNAVQAELQVHSGGSFQATTYVSLLSSIANVAFTPSTSGAVTTYIPLSVAGDASNASGSYGVSGTLRIHGPVTSATFVKSIVGLMTNSSGGVARLAQVSGMWNNTPAITGFQFLFSSGNITSGTIKIYGIP